MLLIDGVLPKDLRATMEVDINVPLCEVARRAASNFKSYAAHNFNVKYDFCGSQAKVVSGVIVEGSICRYFVVGCAYTVIHGVIVFC